MSEPLQKLPCGCTYRGERWVQLCGPEKPGKDHEGEWREVHARWAADSKRMQEIDDLLS